jgi:hypothetical protein
MWGRHIDSSILVERIISLKKVTFTNYSSNLEKYEWKLNTCKRPPPLACYIAWMFHETFQHWNHLSSTTMCKVCRRLKYTWWIKSHIFSNALATCLMDVIMSLEIVKGFEQKR